jgi:hypothetical protein
VATALDYDDVLKGGLTTSAHERQKMIAELEEDLEYELIAQHQNQDFSNLQEMFWESQLREYEQGELIEALVQNDVSVSYDVELGSGKICGEYCDYFPSNFKKVQDSKSEDKVPNFRENEIIYAPVLVTPIHIVPQLKKMGQNYLESSIFIKVSLQDWFDQRWEHRCSDQR